VFAAVGEAVARDAEEPEPLLRLTHRTIKTVTEDLERFRYNTAISKLMVLSNEMRAALDAGHGARAAAAALVPMLAPVAPFAAEELWRTELGHAESVHLSAWPAFDPDLAQEEYVTLVVQVDGKVRDRLQVDADADEAACLATARSGGGVKRALEGREVVKEIVRAPKIVNFVTRD
jgi:leucyl-tRNA synthetase